MADAVTPARVAVVSGVLALVAVGWVALISATPFDPPEVLRIAGSWLFPLGVGGAIGAGLAARRGRGRPLALVGIALAALAVLGLIVLVAALDG